MLLEEVARSTVLVRCCSKYEDRSLSENVRIGGRTQTHNLRSTSEEYLSGLLFEPRLVLCSGLLLRNVSSSPNLSNNTTSFGVLGHLGVFKKYFPKHVSEWEGRVATSAACAGPGQGVRSARSRIAHVPATIVRRFTDRKLADLLSNVLSDWTLGDARQENGEDGDMKRTLELASVFLVLELRPTNRSNNVSNPVDIDQALRNLRKATLSPDIPPASRLSGGGIPFGSSAFLGSLSTGILSAIVGEPPRLALTDLRTAPGSEGGPVFADVSDSDSESRADSWRPFALVLLPVSWCRGEWVGFTILATLRPLLDNALSGSGGPLLRPITAGSSSSVVCKLPWASDSSTRQHPLKNSILLVRCGNLWGTGVVLCGDKRVVVTCSHVLQQNLRHPVRVMWGNNSAEAHIIFRSASDQPFDLAVITIGGSGSLKALKISSVEPRTGDPVLAAGFPLISDKPQTTSRKTNCPDPMLSAGTLSVPPGNSSLLISSCCVQSGSSGGAVLCRRRGQLVGVTVSNAQAAGAVHPSINMAVPAAVLAAPISAFLRSGDVSTLRTLCPNDPEVSREWMLQTPPPSRL